MSDYGIPNEEHLDTMFKAITDTMDQVSGNEAMNLSNAQRYAFAVLSIEDLTPMERVSGNEGFFDKLGSGLKKMWDYIVKMFKSIGNFFFGSSDDSSKKKLAAAKENVEENKKAMTGGEPTEEQSDRMREHQLNIARDYARYVRYTEEFSHDKDVFDPAELQFMKRATVSFQGNIEKAGPYVKKVGAKIPSLATAKSAQDDLMALLKLCEDDQKLIESLKSELSKRIDELTHEMASAGGDPDGMIGYKIKGANLFIKILVAVGKRMTQTISSVTKLSDTIAHTFNEKK